MDTKAASNFDPPNFKTLLPLPVLLKGFREPQRAPAIPLWPMLGILVRSIVHQGLFSNYRGAYWKFLFRLLMHWLFVPRKLSLGFAMLLSGHHFIPYARRVEEQLEIELDKCRVQQGTAELQEETAAC